MKRYNCTSNDKRGAFGLCMEEHKEGAFVPFSAASGLAEQLADATRQCGVMAELLRESIPYVEDYAAAATSKQIAGYHETLIAHMKEALSGKLPEPAVTVTETIRTAPERIWLQVGDQSSDGDYPFPEHHDEVTWCSDSVVSCEVPYVRADLVGNSEQQRDMVHGADTCQRKAMSLDEAIQHAIEKSNSGGECAEQHIQLAIWLGHYQAMLEAKPQGRLITEGQEFELTTVLQSIVNGFSDDPAHDAAALLKRITGEVPWTGDSFQLPPRQGGEQIVKCPHCNAEFQDGSDAAEFIGWHGLCSSCELKGGEPCATEPPSSNPA